MELHDLHAPEEAIDTDGKRGADLPDERSGTQSRDMIGAQRTDAMGIERAKRSPERALLNARVSIRDHL